MRTNKVVLALLLILVVTAAQAGIRVASWNVRHLGWNNDKDIGAVASVIDRFDIVALQEMMGIEAVEELERRLETASDEPWKSFTSAAIGRGAYKEYRLGVEVWT